MNKELIYISATHEDCCDGVYHKIMGFVEAARALGYKASGVFKDHNKSIFKHFIFIIRTNAKYVVIRITPGWVTLALIPIFIISRLQGKKLIIDIPTPLRVFKEEIKKSSGSTLKKARHIAYLYLSGPIPYWFFNTVIQYSNEERYFLLGNRKKTILLGNGIDVNRVALRGVTNNITGNYLTLIGVANLNKWHGFDKIIEAISMWRAKCPEKKIVFHIIGGENSPTQKELIELVKKNNIIDLVIFHNNQNQEYISNFYSISDIAIGSLAFYRINLDVASPLKHREYALAGIPFIYSGVDMDFPKDLPFAFNVSNDDKIDDILRVFESFHERRQSFSDMDIRNHCIDNCSFISKLKQLNL